jgi:hypothetical protein
MLQVGKFRWFIDSDPKDGPYGGWVEGTWELHGSTVTLLPQRVDGDTEPQTFEALQRGDVPAKFKDRIMRLFEARKFYARFDEGWRNPHLIALSPESAAWLGEGYPQGPMTFEPKGRAL